MKNQLLQLCYEIEKLPASEQQTKVSLMASNLVQMYQLPEKYGSSGDYLQDTPPLMFIEDLHDIMFDGDGLTPDKLIADVVKLIKDYLAAQQSVQTDVLNSGHCEHVPDGQYCPYCKEA